MKRLDLTKENIVALKPWQRAFIRRIDEQYHHHGAVPADKALEVLEDVERANNQSGPGTDQVFAAIPQAG